MQTKPKLLYYILLFLAALIWGSSFVVVKSSVEVLPPNFLIFIRFSLACLLLSIIFIKQFKQFRLATLYKGSLCGLFLFLGYSIQTIGIIYTTPGKNAFLTAIYCVAVPFLFWAAGKSKPNIFNIFAALICLVGIGLIALDKGVSAGVNLGDILSAISGLGFALQIVVVAISAQDENPVLLTIVQFGVVAVLALIFSLFTENIPAVSAFTPRLFFEIFYLAVFATAAALLLQTLGQSRVNPSSASLILSFEAVFSVLFSVLVGAESLNTRSVLGFSLVFSAVIISETKLGIKFKRINHK